MAHDRVTPEQHTRLAHEALAQRDLEHAMHHVGCALASDPASHALLGILQHIAGSHPDPLALVTGDGETSFSQAAVRAYLLAGRQQWPEALSLLGAVVETRPDCGYLVWAHWWVQQGAVQGLDFDAVAANLIVPVVKFAANCPTPTDPTDSRIPNLQSAAAILASLCQAHPQQAFCFFGASMVGRRLGTLDDALARAQHALQLEPKWRNCIGVANVLRDMGRVDEAVGMFRQAATYDPSDVSALLDAGDTLLDAERWDPALGFYAEALAKAPEHPHATASSHYARYRKTGDPAARDALLAMRTAVGGRAEELGDLLDPPIPYVTWLPRGGDATCNAMRATFEKMYQNPAEYHGSTFDLALTHLESPSIWAAFRMQMEMWGPRVDVALQVEHIQQPDPRAPKAQVDFQLWRYEGVTATPNVPPSNTRVARLVSDLAAEDFRLELWAAHAKQIARQLGPDDIRHLVGLMAHPPRPPGSEWRVLIWLQRIQVAAALVVAHIDNGWEGSRRKRALYSLLYGPTDWSVDAAIMALGMLARTDAAIKADVLQAFAWLRTQIPEQGFTCFEYPLCATWIACGPHDPATTAMLADWEQRILDGKVGSSSVTSSRIEPATFDQAEEMAKAGAAQQSLGSGGGGDPDPTVFPGQPVPKLSDYVGMMKTMQTGDMMGALQRYGLDMGTYTNVATQWGQALQSDPTLTAKFGQMMNA